MAEKDVDVFEAVDGVEEIGVLKELRTLIDEKIVELTKKNLKPWKEASFKIFWKRISEDAQQLIRTLADNDGAMFKEDLLKNLNWEPMKIPGTMRGISAKSRNMSYEDVVTTANLKDKDDNWRVEYKLNESIKEFVKEESEPK